MSNLFQFPITAVPAAHNSQPPADASERFSALNPQRSFIVEAPAGSGKTGLLVQRFLRLLVEGDVAAPEEILAITFTNKATAELRERVLSELRHAPVPVRDGASDFEQETRALARAAIARDTAAGWRLLDSPERLNIRSIDSVCGAIAGALPVLSGVGGPRAIIPDARPLYAIAAHRTLLRLGGDDHRLHHALRTLLLHRDVNLGDTTGLLATMLGAREQWGELVPLGAAELTDEILDTQVRPRLESALEFIVCSGLSRAAALMPPGILEELARLAHIWSDLPGYNGALSPIGICADLPGPPAERAEALDHWKALLNLVLTAQGEWRRGFNVNHVGFSLSAAGKTELRDLIAQIENDRLHAALKAVRLLPPARYPDDQWRVAKALFVVLRHALAELQVLFSERGECDFTELSLAARQALAADPTAADLALAAGGRLRHLLVDEMQDTSAAQYALLESLTQSWDGHAQTLFLVGDPKQSIYAFRKALVTRFLQTMEAGRLGDLPLQPLQLTANFRSQAALVHAFNDTFGRLFPAPGDDALHSGFAADVPFVRATPTLPAPFDRARSMFWHCSIRPDPNGLTRAQIKSSYYSDEARNVRQVLELWRRKPLPPGREKPWSLAVLAASRSHLRSIAAELRSVGIPFRAVEIEPLADRAEVLDCLALTRALLHPADRIAWLGVLRAPWCGLSRADLLRLTGPDTPDARRATGPELIRAHRALLSPEGVHLLDRVWPVLQHALETLGRTPLSLHVERTWTSLGADAALPPASRSNARRFFTLLAELEVQNDGRVDLPSLHRRLADLYAESEGADTDVQLLTIHKAKGLEWDVVIVPGLERKPQGDRSALLNWMELDGGETGGRIMLAPIYRRGEQADPLNVWLSSARRARERAERKRLFYVACTRARQELHLFASLDLDARGGLANPAAGSLLEACWPAAEPHFAAAPVAGADLLHFQRDLQDSLAALDREMEEQQGAGLALAAAAGPSADDAPEIPAPDDTTTLPLAEPSLLDPPTLLHRLPRDFDPGARFRAAAAARLPYTPGEDLASTPAFSRPEGSFRARAFGNVVHRFLQLLASRLAAGDAPAALRAQTSAWAPRITTSLRAEGLSPAAAASDAPRVLSALANTLDDPAGLWTLSPLDAAATEVAFSTPAGTLRADRVFRAGDQPLSAAGDHLWIVDYKTSEPGAYAPEEFAAREREKYAPQMEAYARVLRSAMPGHAAIRLGLYFPLAQRFLFWDNNPLHPVNTPI